MSLFPYAVVRQEQDVLLEAIQNAVATGKPLVAHAPTGLGKTAAALSPAIEHALKHDKVVFFLTSRLTQHALALQTVKEIRNKHDVEIPVVDLIGKKHMCLQPNVDGLSGKDFADYCKALREDGLCEFYERLKTGEELSPQTRATLLQIGKSVVSPDEVKGVCGEAKLCPYEVTLLMAKNARVVITDYSYVFKPKIREGLLGRLGRTLQDCIVIVDEAHNLPERVKDLATERITAVTIGRARKELEQHDDTLQHYVQQLGEALDRMAGSTQNERYVQKEEFLAEVERIADPTAFIAGLLQVAIRVREEQKASSCGALANFLASWMGDDEGFTRIISVEMQRQQSLTQSSKRAWQLSYRCLDPSLSTLPVFSEVAAVVLMSGTLTPTKMHAELAGVPDATLLTLPSAFPSENRLNLVVPKTTTQFKQRSPEMYKKIAQTVHDTLASVRGNAAVFFPSYAIMDAVRYELEQLTGRTLFEEQPGMTREEREGLLARFRSHLMQGGVLLGVMGGSFGEGVDLPGDQLRAVIIVGLPLGKPDLEMKALIAYYDEKFGRGWEYGYTFPAFSRTLQSAGRCIRSETDKGVIVFLDERYAWEQYYKCFPADWHIRVSLKHEELVKTFFGAHDGTA